MKYTRLLGIVATAAISALSTSVYASDIPSVYSPGGRLCGMSDNAAWAIGATSGDTDVDNPHGAGGVLIDLSTHHRTTISAPSGWAEVRDVADNGTVVGSSLGKPAYWSPETEEWTTLSVPPLYGGGCFTAVTPDAHYAVGYFADSENDLFVYPMYFDLTTGESKELTGLPTLDMSGLDQHMNVFYDISPDGRYVLGQMSQAYLLPVALFSYVYDMEKQTWSAIGYDYDSYTEEFTPQVENLYYINDQHMSCDGTWVTGAAYMVFDGGEMTGGSEAFYPYRYNVLTKEFEVYSGPYDVNVAGNQITSDGVVLGCSPMGNPYPTAVIRTGRYFVALDQIIHQIYETTVTDLIHDSVTGAFEAISADGLTALMITYDNSYIITMPEQFVDAAARIDLFANYTLNIPEGSKINRVSEVKITFDRAISVMNYPQNIKLLDGEGNVVRSASGFTVSPSNENTAVVTFRSTTLTPDVTYTIDVPENMVWLKDDPSVKAKRIEIHYTGREEGPIQLKRALPADGAAVAQFNSNPDYLVLTFDTPVAISETAQCNLYKADDNSLVASFTGIAAGENAVFFPLATYVLYRGSDYKVVISAGSVTDLSGSGPNEEIVLNYEGAYVREISNDDIYLFNSTCDTYDEFIFWQRESHNPASTPRRWGFEADIPWLLIRDNENTTDMALCAHSMFTPVAEADAWLVIPQLHIPDANVNLAFDAQSYMSGKDDNLKVIVYADDAVYNYFSAELADQFRAEGNTAFDEIVPAGATDEGLTDEWTHYAISLAPFAGKDVYIAFVYNNFNKSAIFIDNVQVIRDMDFLITNKTPESVVDAQEVTVSALLTVGSETLEVNGLTLRLTDDEGEVVDQIDEPTVHLAYGDSYDFSFSKPLPLTVGKETAYSIEIVTGDLAMTNNYTVKDLLFEPVKRVVLEEYTGAACGNCPLGIQAINNLTQLYPDNFIPITLRTYLNDPYSAGAVDYTTFLGLNAAPSGRINRGPILAPMVQTGSDGLQFFGKGITTDDGKEAYLWADAVQDALNVPADAELSSVATYDPEIGYISVSTTFRFALDRDDSNIGVFAVVLEDGLQTIQLNYYNSFSDPNLGEWGSGGIYGTQTVTSWLADDVARYVVNGLAFNGTSVAESDFAAGAEYSITLNGNVPNGRLSNTANCHVVVMLINRADGTVINAIDVPLIISGISDITTDDSTDCIYYDLHGRLVNTPEPGHIYVRVKGSKTDKVRYSF